MKTARFNSLEIASSCFALALFASALLIGARPASSAAGAAGFPQGQPVTIYCASDDMRRHGCPVDTRGGVELARQKSEARCVYDRTWGYDDRGIWVDRGCRADFLVGQVAWEGFGEGFNVYCASDDGGRETCPVDARRGVRLIRQRSGSPCVLGQTWGYGLHGIWVDRGCRADFRVAGDWSARAASLIYCASDDMRRHGCPVETRDGVVLVRQRSGSDCIFGRTWGFDRGGIWVDRGCRADFEIVDRRDEEWRDSDDRRDRDDRRDHDDRRDRDDHRDRDDRPPY
jgi:Protein of unknown function (DUF3011)